MDKYYLRRRDDGRIDEIWLDSDQAAFNYAIERGRREGTTYSAYDEFGRLIFGVYQNNDSGHFMGVCK